MLVGAQRALLRSSAVAAGGGGGAFAVNYLANSLNTTDTDVWTFSSVSFGTADSGRKICVPVYTLKADPAATVSGVTIGGVSASLVTGTQGTVATGGATHLIEMWQAAVPTGTSGDIVVTCSATTARMGIGVWNVISGTSSSGGHSQSASASSLNTGSSLVIPASGVGICYAFSASSGGFSSWTNVDGDGTGDFEAQIEATRSHAGARRSTAGSTQVTANADGSGVILMAWVAYGP